LSGAHAAYVTGRSFFPKLISGPFENGLREAFGFAAGMCLVAAVASFLRGGKYVHREEPELAETAHQPLAPDGVQPQPALVGPARADDGR
jgi:hypothetical protein